MATSDLVNELQKDSFKVDADSEKRISAVRVATWARARCQCLFGRLTWRRTRRTWRSCQAVLKQLEDASPDVQGLAVKWCASTERKRLRADSNPRAR